MTTEIKTAVDNIAALTATIRSEVDGVKAQDALHTEKLGRIEADLASAIATKSALEGRLAALETAAARPGLTSAKSDAAADSYKDAFLAYVRDTKSFTLQQNLEMAGKSINIANTAQGGVAVPRVIGDEIASVALDLSPVRQLARVVTVSTSDYREILSNSDQGSGWAGEDTTRAVTGAGTFAAVVPTFGEVYATAEISNHALNDVFFDVQAFLVDALSRKFAAAEGAAFVTGNGTDKPTGLLNGSTISTVKTGAAATLGSNPYDALIDLRYGVKGEYAQNGSWLLNSATLAQLVKVKDSTGNYIYQPAIAAGVAETLLGRPVFTDENMPVVAANAKPVIFGDFKRGYLIADLVGLTVIPDQVTNKGFLTLYASKRVGGVVKDANALKALVVAA